METLKNLKKKFHLEIESVKSIPQLETLKTEYLGSKGSLNSLLKNIKSLSKEERQRMGGEINSCKQDFEKILAQKKEDFEAVEIEKSLRTSLDPTLPAPAIPLGRLHPLTALLNEVVELFREMGFQIAKGPEIETDENNFNALNIPMNHPARDLHDTFYIGGDPEKRLLRTHTSPVQIRVMREIQPPLKIVVPGKVFRHEAIDATHSSVFHQVEGLSVGRDVSFSNLKNILEYANQKLFGSRVKTRFRPSYFPFVEPGAEVDISCTLCNGTGSSCAVCKQTGWIEMLGAGMVHPNVFKAVGYDPQEWTGFAFGMGIERMAMVRYGINDIRLFYENHLDFLSQF